MQRAVVEAELERRGQHRVVRRALGEDLLEARLSRGAHGRPALGLVAVATGAEQASKVEIFAERHSLRLARRRRWRCGLGLAFPLASALRPFAVVVAVVVTVVGALVVAITDLERFRRV